jgi:hypothetical protein
MLLVGCAASKPGLGVPLPIPAGISVEARRYPGNALEGPLKTTVDIGSDLVTVSFALYYLEHSPAQDLPLLAEQSGFVADLNQEAPLQATPLLGARTSIGRGEEAESIRSTITSGGAGRFALVKEKELALPIGVTAVLGGRATDVVMAPPASWDPDPVVQIFDREVSLHISRAADHADLELLLILAGPVPSMSYDPDNEVPEETTPPRRISINERMSGREAPPRWIARHEFVQPREPLSCDGESLVFLVRSPFDQFSERIFVLFAEARTSDRPLSEADREALRSELAASTELVQAQCQGPDVAEVRNQLLIEALGRLTDIRERRRSLILLADRVGARLGIDFALIADETLLIDYLERIDRSVDELKSFSDERLAWLLERRVYALLIDQLISAEAPPELLAILLRHAGEVARYSTTIEEILASSESLADLDRQLSRSNFLFLEDPDPSSRVRAFDWLAIRGETPDGYDPLAPIAERRAVLLRIEEEGMNR